MYNRSTQRAIIGILLTCFCFVFVVASFWVPQPVLATAHPIVIAEDIPARVEKAEASFGNQILASAIIGLLNTITLVGQQLAYDLAVGLSSGCRGENACAFTKDPGTYFTAVAYDAAGEFIGNLAESWEFLGFSLCNPRIPDVGLAIALGLAEKFQRPKPKCDFVNTINNWQNTVREVRDPHALLKHASLAFEPGNTDLGQAAIASQEFQIHIKRKEEAEKAKRDEGKGILPQSGIISGNITTPAVVIKSEYEDLPRSGKENTITSGDVVSGLIGKESGNIWASVGTTVLSTFANTLASRMLKAALSGIFGETNNAFPDLTQAIGNAFGDGSRQSAPGLSQSATALLTPQIRASNGGFEYVAELAAGCQSKPEERTQFQCTIDNKFMVAIQQSQTGTPLTVAEAVNKGYLNRSATFGFATPASDPPSEPSVTEGYPYSSMKKLRLLRIIPLGWEFAALKINQDDEATTLGDVVDGYADEGDSAGCQGTTVDSQESRFCGLVDPNWVLKAPPATCGAIVWSSMVDSSGSGRQEVCADLKHCVAEGASGDCQAWGYCTREKNTWRFDADTCDKQYASCDTFTPKEGTTQSLLENTVDFGSCNADNAGCVAYVTSQTTPGTWNPASTAVYLDRDAAKCDQSAAGCTEFVVPTPEQEAILEDGEGEDDGQQPDLYSANAQKQYLRIPPDYLGCTGEAADRSECSEYSRYCRPEEKGCELYSPATSDSAVPGVVTGLDRCDAKCVGYDSYLKLGSRFEPQFTRVALTNVLSPIELARLAPSIAPQEDLYPLIARTATACSAQFAGCDEFTNLRTESREYYSDLRACQTPSPDSQTYFTWEGSDTTGYQLKTWSFKRSSAVALGTDELAPRLAASIIPRPPCTNYAVATATDGSIAVNCTDSQTNQASCDPATSPNPADCRAFYDGSGNIFRRLLSRTIVSTEDCQSFRWTGLPRQPEISPQINENADQLRLRLEEASCKASHGSWSDTVHQCLYLGAPTLSQSCPAQLNGCRGFRGNTGSNTANIVTETFDPVSILLVNRGWAAFPSGLTTLTYSSEALVVQEHSLKVEGAGAGEGVARALTTTTGTVTTPLITAGSSYFLTMNVKGTASRALKIAVSSGAVEDVFSEEIPLTPEWRLVEIGPLTLQNITADILSNADPKLVIRNARGSAITFFIDDLTVKEVRDTVYLIKHSSVVDPVCDTLPAEAGGGYLRGAALGCRAYTDRANAPHTLKSFSSLCRPQSAGCTDLIDTRNSASPFIEQFNTSNNGVCRGVPGDCYLSVGGSSIKVCHIALNKTSCAYGPLPLPQCSGTPGASTECSYVTNLAVDDRTVLADIHRFVVVDPAKSCQGAQAGCQALGHLSGGQSSALIPTVYRKNNPNEYGASLCTYEARGCETWTRSDSSVAYFRAPQEGAGGCVWKTNTPIGSAQYLGWFKAEKQPVGNQSLVNTKELCSGYGTWDFVRGACINAEGNSIDESSGDNSCGGVACDVNLCTRGAGGTWKQLTATSGQCESEAPCYGSVIAEIVADHPKIRVAVADTYLIGGTTFGIYRNADALYAGRAGGCPDEQATCTALLDPTDKSEGVESDGKAYYLKDNARLIAAREECDGKVSRAQGCVLLNNEEDPSDIWSAEQSYLASDRERGELVSPVSLPPNGNDTNTIIKVQRDRVCAEWYQCTDAKFVWLDRESRYKTVCSGLGRCNESAATPEEGGASINTCGSWVNNPLLNKPPQIDASACTAAWGSSAWNGVEGRCAIPEDITGENDCKGLGGVWVEGSPGQCRLGALKESTYRLRDRTFGGQDYTGYSIPNLYGIDQIKEVNVGTVEDPKYRLAFIIPGTNGCTSPGTNDGDDGCPGTQQCTTEGRCARAFDASGSVPWPPEFPNGAAYCRGYPERTSPFINTWDIKGDLSFENVSHCNEGGDVRITGNKCECDYTKVEYTSGTRYYPLNTPNEEAPSSDEAVGIEDAFCEGSEGTVITGVTGATAEACQTAGNTWQTLKKRHDVFGWHGYCLELDPSRLINSSESNACLTWFPIDQLPSVQDIDNLYDSASYMAGNEDSLARGTKGAYYCLAGGAVEEKFAIQNPKTFRDPIDGNTNDVGHSDQNKIQVWTANISGRGIYRYDIKEVRIKISNYGDGEGPGDGTYKFVPGEISQGDVPVGTLTDDNDPVVSPGYDNRGFNAYNFESILSSADDPLSQWWWWGGDDNNDGGYGNGGSNYESIIRSVGIPRNTISTAFMTEANFLATSGNATDGTPRGLDTIPLSSYASYEEHCDNWIGTAGTDNDDEGYDGVYAALHFDPVTQLLDFVRIGDCNVDAGAPGIAVDGTINKIEIDLHPHCKYLAKIDDTTLGSRNSAPNTVCLDPTTPTAYTRHSYCPVSFTNYSPTTPAYTPYGSSSAGTEVDPTDIDSHHPWFLNHNRMEQAYGDQDFPAHQRVPFAGWPFACLDADDRNCKVNSRLPLPGGGEVTTGIRTPFNEDHQTDLEFGVGEFHSLFAKSFEVFEWNETDKKYAIYNSSDAKWDVRTGGNNAGPSFRAVIEHEDGDTEASASTGHFSVNGQYQPGSIVQGVNGHMLANMKFWAWAYESHLPIINFRIDWGDEEGPISYGTGLYKNARAVCNGSSFDLTADACQEEPHSFEHLYSCSGEDDVPFWKAGTQCPVVEFQSLYGGCCVFRPKVQATDNWGFCNGTCEGDAPTPADWTGENGPNDGNKCFEEECTATADSTNNPWDIFPGQVVVAP